jgi:uncharacterized protein (DUF1330 family)
MYLVGELALRDERKFYEYARKVLPLLERHGGEVLGVTDAVSVIEGKRRPGLVVLHRWPSREAFDAFWTSPEYAPLRRLRQEAADSQIITFEGLSGKGPK